jgi:uncharacterized protein (DUF4213/DUF364 family)
MKKFIELLSDPILASPNQQKKEIWDVEGRLKNGNQTFKFDIRPLKQVNNKLEKIGYFQSKSDKIVFETSNEWIIFDTEELHQYIKTHKLTDIALGDIINKLDWNIFLPKH